MRIVASEVGIFRCRFDGIDSCKNPEYCMVKLAFELELAGEVKDWKALPQTQYLLHDAGDISKLQHCQKGQAYLMQMSVGLQSANERDGKTYPASVRYKVLKVIQEAREAV